MIRDGRRLRSFKLPSHYLKICLVAIIGLGIVSVSAVLLQKHTGTLHKNEITTGMEAQTKPHETRNTAKEIDSDAVSTTGQPHNLSIENFQGRFNPSKKLFNYSFLLKNRISKNTTSGHIFVILKSDNVGAEQWLSDPHTVLSQGIPQNFKDGDPFSITKHKFITKAISSPNIYEYAAIFVFSTDGKLVLEKSFSLKN